MPGKAEDGQKLAGTPSRFGGTTAVLKDLDCLGKRPGKNNSFFATRQLTGADVLLFLLIKIFNLLSVG